MANPNEGLAKKESSQFMKKPVLNLVRLYFFDYPNYDDRKVNIFGFFFKFEFNDVFESSQRKMMYVDVPVNFSEKMFKIHR